jgi:hypothetical protein
LVCHQVSWRVRRGCVFPSNCNIIVEIVLVSLYFHVQ